MFIFAMEYTYISVLGKEEEHSTSTSQKTGSELNECLSICFVRAPLPQQMKASIDPREGERRNTNMFTDFHSTPA